MHPFVEYELRVAISLLFFWLYFHFVLRKQPFHHFNRIIILVSSFLCVFSPLIPIRFNREISILPNQLIEETPVPDHGFVFWGPLIIILIGISVVFISKLLSWRAMARFSRHGSHIPMKGKNRLVEIDSSYFSPFVWFNTIFVCKTKAWLEDPVLMHELEHIRQRHTWDVLYTDILVIFQWFNPAVWLIQRDLKDIHEYEADAGVLSMGYDMRKYVRIVLKLSAKTFGYVDNLQFASGSVRRRIEMIRRFNHDTSPKKFRYFFILPGVLLAVLGAVRVQNHYVPGFAVLEPVCIYSYSSEFTGAAKNLDIPVELVGVDGFKGEMPELISESRLPRWIVEHLPYPQDNATGVVIAQFSVTRDGKMRDLSILQGAGNALDKAVLSVLSRMPDWSPAHLEGEPIDLTLVQPVFFRK